MSELFKKISLTLIIAFILTAVLLTPFETVFAQESTPKDCAWYEFGCYIENVILPSILGAIVSFGGLILWMSGKIFNTAIDITILQMSATINNTGTGIGAAITSAWVLFRDVANLGFIFILLYIAIKTILGVGGIDTKKLLTRVILVALFLNFSLFFTKVIIDVSNTGAVVFHNAILKQQTIAGDYGIAGPFMETFGLTGIWSPKTAGDRIAAAANGDIWGQIGVSILFLIFLLVAAFVFFAMSIMFLLRYVKILFLFVLSPLAFAAMALPNDGYSGRWWKSLWKQVIFAPACLALLFIVLGMVNAVVKTATGGVAPNISSAITRGADGLPASNAGGMILSFIMVIAFTIGALVIAQETGASGAKGMMKLGKKWRGNLTGFVGRNTAGRLASRVDKWAGDKGLGNTALGRSLRASTVGAMAKSGFGSKTGFSKAEEEKKKADAKFANRRLEMARERAKKKHEDSKDESGASAGARELARAETATKFENTEIAAHKQKKETQKSTIEAAEKAAIQAKKDFDTERMTNPGSTEVIRLQKVMEDKETALNTEKKKMVDLEKQETGLIDQLAKIKTGEIAVTVEKKHEEEALKKLIKEEEDLERAKFDPFAKKGIVGTAAQVRKTGSSMLGTAAKGAAIGVAIGSLAGPVGTTIGVVGGTATGLVQGYRKRKELSKRNKVVAETLRTGRQQKVSGKVEDALKKMLQDNPDIAKDLGAGGEKKEEKEGEEGEGGGEKK